MFTVNHRVGRLIEARIKSLSNVAAAERYGAAFAKSLREVARPVLCADHRPVAIYSQPVADELVLMFTNLNKQWERVAILVASSNATLAMQLQRIVRESRNPSRRVFFDPNEAASFLGEILSTDERARVTAFLGEPA